MTLAEKLETRDFYELCQQYRHSLIGADEFNAIRDYIKTGNLPWPSYDASTDEGSVER